MGLVACLYRAAEWRHRSILAAAYELLEYLDDKTGCTGFPARLSGRY